VPHLVGARPEVKTIARVKTHCSQTTFSQAEHAGFPRS
jgi:hypothetical protein